MTHEVSLLLLKLPNVETDYLTLKKSNLESQIWPPLTGLANVLVIEIIIFFIVVFYLIFRKKTILNYNIINQLSREEKLQHKKWFFVCIGIVLFLISYAYKKADIIQIQISTDNNINIITASGSALTGAVLFSGLLLLLTMSSLPVFTNIQI